MADDYKSDDQQSIDSAINKLEERKNDDDDKPSTSAAQKRPSPNSNYHESSKRVNRTKSKDDSSDASVANVDSSTANVSVYDDSDDSISNEAAGSSKNTNCNRSAANHKNDSNSHTLTKQLDSTSKSNFPIKPVKRVVTTNPALLNEEFITEFSSEWLAADSCSIDKETKVSNNDNVKLYNKPYKICVIQDFLHNTVHTERMVQEMCQMEWQRKQMDLYEFHQTTDLANLSINSPKHTLRRFYNMLNHEVLNMMRQVTGLPLTHVSASCSMYNYGDHLLVHDDLLSDRQIAFVYYLSPWFENWSDEMGGALELFDCDIANGQPKYPIVRKFPPRNNQFVFFRVCQKSFHQVGEVTNLVYPRLTINGWFHGPLPKSSDSNTTNATNTASDSRSSSTTNSATNSATEGNSVLQANSTYQHAPLNDELNLTEWINTTYLKKRTKLHIQNHIEEKSEASLELFLIPDFYDLLVTEFRENTELEWVLEGPANQRKYETLRFSAQSTGPPKDLYTLFTSKSMFRLLHEFTELDFDGLNAKTPTCSVQICRFTQGCYTLLGDSSTFGESGLDVILFFNAKDDVGKITYLSLDSFNDYNTIADAEVGNSKKKTGDSDEEVSVSEDDTSADTSAGGSGTVSSTVTQRATSNQQMKKPIWKSVRSSNTKQPASPSQPAKDVETTDANDDTGDDDLSTSNEQDAEIVAIMKNVDAINSMVAVKNATSQRRQTTKRPYAGDNDSSDDSDNSSRENDNDSDHYKDVDELAEEDILLTVLPKNNSLNLVYRLYGQSKFVKYISKNCISPDEYVYILFATFKE